jgi:hypothetical protein
MLLLAIPGSPTPEKGTRDSRARPACRFPFVFLVQAALVDDRLRAAGLRLRATFLACLDNEACDAAV